MVFEALLKIHLAMALTRTDYATKFFLHMLRFLRKRFRHAALPY
jgi:hypothetical protein